MGFARYVELRARRADVFRQARGSGTWTWRSSFAGCSRAGCRHCRARSRRWPTRTDHLTTMFSEVRLKSYLEMRGADGGPWRSQLRAAGALDRGAVRPEAAGRGLGLGFRSGRSRTHAYLRAEAPRQGAQVAGSRAPGAGSGAARCWRSPRSGCSVAPRRTGPARTSGST